MNYLKKVLPVLMRCIWILIVVFNTASLMISFIAFALTSNQTYVSNVLEISMLMAIGITGLIENLKKKV
ncbi:hypothetical protein [Coprobacillus cateniformis]|uniref:hypothetical protein n=1 Tax=Coprobacillus cateniformis TaxID=100884 RepID=UPI0005D1EDBD|nr:hypothetical protein [Coprobacillus cateniformis]